MSAIRSFIALPTAIEIQREMASIQSELKETEADVKWDSYEKFHITLKFLGNVEQSKIELISNKLVKQIQSFPSFEITYELLGAFPNLHNPRVVWIGTKSNQHVLDLQSAIESVCSEFGFPKEDRVFHPHITFGRVKGTRNLTRLTEAIKTITFEPMQSSCAEVLLMKSDLQRDGSVYTIMKSFPLQP